MLAVTTDYSGLIQGQTPATETPEDLSRRQQVVARKPAFSLKTSERRRIESEMIDVDRSIQRLERSIAGYQKQLEEVDRLLNQSVDAAHEADTTLKQAVVGFAGGFAIGRQIALKNQIQRAQLLLDEKRDRSAELKKRLIELQD